MIKIRTDKFKPNNHDVAERIWDIINKPITENLIRGLQFGLVFRYHNRIKSEIYHNLVNVNTLLCIGSGKGGDVDKWIAHKYTHVICVEPDPDNIKELVSRLTNVPFKYKILQTIGQNYETIKLTVENFIPTKKVDAIVYMLSLSFFFDNTESFDSIFMLSNNLLKIGGYLGYLSIDGNKVSKLFNDPQNYQKLNNVLKLNFTMITFEYLLDQEKIHIHIPNSIVSNQLETLTNLECLNDELINTFKFTLFFKKDSDDKLLMTDEELLYNSLFTYAIYQNT